MASRLVIVPTPIGNLADVTLRALDALRQADAVACEDTRHTAKLLRHYQIKTPLLRLDQHTMDRAARLLREYKYLAYASDAGTPGISDPGAELVSIALQLGVSVEVLPGATALIPALVVSGLPTARFVFEGFLPQSGKARRDRLEALARERRTIVLYESPHRLQKTLSELAAVFGSEHEVAVVREISKKHEEVWRGSLRGAGEHYGNPRGEFVLVLAGAAAVEKESGGLQELEASLKKHGLSGRALAEALEAAGLSRNEARKRAYQKEER